MEVTTVEYKINFLNARQGGTLHAVGRVVRGGKRIIVTTLQKFGVIKARKQCVKVRGAFAFACLMHTVVNARSLASTLSRCSMLHIFSHTLVLRVIMSKTACC